MNGPETVLQDIVDKIKAKLAAKITSLGFTDPTVPPPAEIVLGDRNLFLELPAVEVMWLPSVVEDDIRSRLDVNYGVGVRFYVAERDQPTLELVTMRFAKALILVLWDAREASEFTNFTLRFEGGAWQQSDVRRNEQEQLERDVLIPFRCWVAEERT